MKIKDSDTNGREQFEQKKLGQSLGSNKDPQSLDGTGIWKRQIPHTAGNWPSFIFIQGSTLLTS